MTPRRCFVGNHNKTAVRPFFVVNKGIMQLNQTSIYRGLELLMDWYLPIDASMPKVDALKNLGNFFQTNLLEAMTTFAFAWKTEDVKTKLGMIDDMTVNLALANTAINNLYRFSSRKDQKLHAISQTQYATYLEKMMDIKSQLGGWRRKTASKA